MRHKLVLVRILTLMETSVGSGKRLQVVTGKKQSRFQYTEVTESHLELELSFPLARLPIELNKILEVRVVKSQRSVRPRAIEATASHVAASESGTHGIHREA